MEPAKAIVTARELLEAGRRYDDYKNVHFDLSKASALDQKEMQKAILKLIPEIMEVESKNGKHVFTVTFNSKHVRMHKLGVKCGMVYQFANAQIMMKKCFNVKHEDKTCNYPRAKTTSVGTMGVVFNKNCTEFVCLEEIEGPYLGPKPITATVDNDIHFDETPLGAFVREAKEEANVIIDVSKVVYVGNIWTSRFRQVIADTGFIFAACVEKSEQTLVAQESEVRNVRWMNVQEFLNMKLPVKHDKPVIFQEAVRRALVVMKTPEAGTMLKYAWGSGLDNELYCSVASL